MIDKNVPQENIEMLTLKIVQMGTDEKNFKILMMLPADTKSIMKEIGLTKMPVNVRLNKLQEMGLVKRCGNTILTDLGKDLIQAVDKCRDMVMIKAREILESD